MRTHMPFLRPVAFVRSAILSSVDLLHSLEEAGCRLETSQSQILALLSACAEKSDCRRAKNLVFLEQLLNRSIGHTRDIGPEPDEPGGSGDDSRVGESQMVQLLARQAPF